MKNLILFGFLLVFTALNGQTRKEKYALELFSNMDYHTCADVFEELADKSLKKNESKKYLSEKAALSNYYIRDYATSEKYFLILAEKGLISSELSYMFYDCLLRTKNYSMISKHQKQIPKEAVVDAENHLNELSKDSILYSIKDGGFNSGSGDYAAVEEAGKLYYSSSKDEIGYTHKQYVWDNLNYSNVYVKDSLGVKLVKEFASEYHDGPIAFNQGKVYLTRTRYIKKGDKRNKHVGIFIVAKDGSTVPVPFEYNSESYNVGHACFYGENKMYFASDMPGGEGESDIYVTEFVNGKWSKPINLGKQVNSIGDEMFPFVDSMGVLYFSSNGKGGYGGLDIFSFTEETGTVKNLGSPINTNYDDFSFILNKNERSGYLSSDRNSKVDKIYSFNIKEIVGTLNVNVVDFLKKIPVVGAEVYLVDRASGDSVLVIIGSEEILTVPIKKNADYILVAKKKNYELHSPLYLNTSSLKQDEIIKKDLFLVQTQYDLIVKTVVKGTDLALGEVEVEFLDPNTGEKIKCITDVNGIAHVNINNNYGYLAFAHKKGYLDLNQNVHTDAMNLIELDLKMEEIKKDITFKIENILYDLDKANLREESKVELDKLVNFLVLNDNIKVELSSHTDSRASNKYNKILSQKRAQSCVDYLISKGVNKALIVAKGYGEEKLLNECSDGIICTEAQHQLNRRTELKILSVN